MAQLWIDIDSIRHNNVIEVIEMKLNIYRAKPSYIKNPAALTFKECVIVEFPNCISTTTNKPFQWMPRSIEQKIIVNGLAEVDRADMEKWIKCLLKAANYLERYK